MLRQSPSRAVQPHRDVLDALLLEDAPAGHSLDQTLSFQALLASERPFTKNFTSDLVLPFVAALLFFMCLLLPAPKTLARLLWHVFPWGPQSHPSPPGDMLYAAGQLPPPAAPATRAENPQNAGAVHGECLATGVKTKKPGKRPRTTAPAAKMTPSVSFLWKGLMLLRWPVIIKL